MSFNQFCSQDGSCGCAWRGASLAARIAGAIALIAGAFLLIAVTARADDGFNRFIAGLWPEAEKAGVKRATFDAAFRGLTPDFSLPDLVLPGRDAATESSRGQAEFTRAPKDYLDAAYLAKLAAQGKELAQRHKAALERIEKELGVDRWSVLAIWGRETAFGQHKLPHDAIRVLATQAYAGRRKELFRDELIAALRMLEAGIPRADMRASWAGAMGLTQFMPSEFFKHTHDLDGDGKADIFRSVPDALASAARQLQGKGWVAMQRWGHEVRVPPKADCALEGPTQARPLADWIAMGFTRAGGRPFNPKEHGHEAYLMMPAGAYGPAFLVFENYRVIRRYNTSDLYAVFVGHLADRIEGGGDFEGTWGGTGPQKTRTIEDIQQRLKALGYDVEKIDGKVGSNTRKVIGTYQRAAGLKVDCWPSDAVLAHMKQAAAR